VLIDEVDQHLHPGWQQRILPALRDAFPRVQFIVTTHSPEVLSTVESEQIRILERGECNLAPAGTLGAESHRLLKDVLGLQDFRPPIPEVNDLRNYLRMIEEGEQDTQQAQQLRKDLDRRYQGNEPQLNKAERMIRNRGWLNQ
jgi:predicted ATP-binding protein involved in virulence